MDTFKDLPVVVIGAGPVGLAAAVRLVERGICPLVLERGLGAGAAVDGWGHVRVFSPWGYNIDAAEFMWLDGQTGAVGALGMLVSVVSAILVAVASRYSRVTA